MTDQEFDVAWRGVANQVFRMCRHALHDDSLAEEVAQQVALRAWRGSATFRGDAPFVAWVCTIAKNEIRRMIHKIQKEREREQMTENAIDSAVTPTPEYGSSEDWISGAVSDAIADGSLTQDEGRCLLGRLANPDSWEDVSADIALSATHCAVLHCRAIPKLRVYLFLRYGGRLWRPDAIEDAIREAAADPAQPLTKEEEQVFRTRLKGDESFRRRGGKGLLRSACEKIMVRAGFAFVTPGATLYGDRHA